MSYPYSVMLARFPGNNSEHPDSSGYYIGLQETLINDGLVSKIVPFKVSDTPITMCRNLAVKTALDQGVDYLLMIDSDMSPDCEPGAPPFWETAWKFMTERRKAEASFLIDHHRFINDPEAAPSTGKLETWAQTVERVSRMPEYAPATIAAPYCGPPPEEFCYVFQWGQKECHTPNATMQLGMVPREIAAYESGIKEVAALPTGLILYDVRLFKTLPPPWFDYEYDEPWRTRKITTEDVFQTRNASVMGFPQFVAWDCWAGHVKLKTVRKPMLLTVQSMRGKLAEALMRSLPPK